MNNTIFLITSNYQSGRRTPPDVCFLWLTFDMDQAKDSTACTPHAWCCRQVTGRTDSDYLRADVRDRIFRRQVYTRNGQVLKVINGMAGGAFKV